MKNYRISESICIRYILVLVLTFTLLSLPQQSFSVDVTNEEGKINGTTTTLGFTPLSTVTYTTNFGVKTSY